MFTGAIVAAAVGGIIAVVEGLLFIELSSLGEGGSTRTDGIIVLILGVVVLATVVFARRRPLLLGVTTAVAALVGFSAEGAPWFLAAVFLFLAAALAAISERRRV